MATEEDTEPEILGVDECSRLLTAAREHKRGKLLGYIVLGLFGGMRPFEAARLRWQRVNFVDDEIRIDAATSKTGRSPTIEINPTLEAWLLLCDRDRPFAPGDWGSELRAIRKTAGIGRWPHDVLRHTAISHHWRRTGSYGLTAQWAGNSEAIIRDHYQSLTTSSETARFFSIMPHQKGGTK